ncbi:MAG: metal-dependent transcriptional regulator [Firmicutes bacterium]|nr:metal-dependent transcriptional regulator [Bacillota bacterium]
MFHKGESVEDYLETILRLSKYLPQVRSIDIVHDTGYTKPSVSVAMKNLRQKEYIVMDESGYITLTEEGRAIAEATFERHQVITRLFVNLGVSEEVAAEDACKVEHVLSEETFNALKNHLGRYGK